MKTIPKTLVLIILAGTALTPPAWAEDVPPVVQALLANWKAQLQIAPTYESIKDDGAGNIIIAKLAVSKAAEGPAPAMNLLIDEIELEGVSDTGNGIFEIGKASFAGAKVDIKGADGMDISVAMTEGIAEGWYVKAAGDNPTPEDALRAAMNVAKKMSSGKITAQAMGQTITSDGYESTWDGDPQTGAGSFTIKVSNVAIPETAIAMIDPSGTLKQLGYAGLNFDVTGDGKIDIGDGKMGLNMNFAYIGKDMGALKFSFDAGEVPLSLYGELQKAQATGKEPDIAAMMPELQNVTLGGVSFRFEDNSITKKVLPLIAAMQGMDEAAMVANAGAMMQIGLMQLNNQAFTDQVVGAVNSFLKDPKSITVSMKPSAPLKVQELMTLNPANPGEAVGMLGVSITAND